MNLDRGGKCAWGCYLCTKKCKIANSYFNWKTTFEAALFLLHTSKKGVEKKTYTFEPSNVRKYLLFHINAFPNLKDAIEEDEAFTKQKAESIVENRLSSIALNKNYTNIFGQVNIEAQSQTTTEYWLKLNTADILPLFEFDSSFDTASIPNYHNDSAEDTPETYFEVEQILDSKESEDEHGKQVTLYLVKWKGYDGEDTWEPYKNVFHTHAYKKYSGEGESSESLFHSDIEAISPSQKKSPKKHKTTTLLSLMENMDNISPLPRRKGFKYSPQPYKYKAGQKRVPIVLDSDEEFVPRRSPRKKQQRVDIIQSDEEKDGQEEEEEKDKEGNKMDEDKEDDVVNKEDEKSEEPVQKKRRGRPRKNASNSSPKSLEKDKPSEATNSQTGENKRSSRSKQHEATPSKPHSQPEESNSNENNTDSPSPSTSPASKKQSKKKNKQSSQDSEQDKPSQSTPRTRSATRAEAAKETKKKRSASASPAPSKPKQHKKRRSRYSLK